MFFEVTVTVFCTVIIALLVLLLVKLPKGSGSDEKKQTYDSTVTNTESGSDEKKQTYDSTVINTGSGSDKTQTEYEKQRTETENTRVHGNIGVTTSQQMIESEMSLRAKYDIYKIISREFEREFLVQIY